MGKSNIDVSALAMGTDLIGSKIGRQRSFELFDFYSESGGTFIDTANFYASWFPGCQGGESETTIGAWMRERNNRDRMVISSKLAFDYPGCSGGLTAAEIERECEKSLRRLQTDRIDFYQAHRDDRGTHLDETMAAFERLIKAGKIRAAGASNLHLWRIAEANVISRRNGWDGYSVVEQKYTYLRPRHGADFGPQIFISQELKDYAQSHQVALIGYSVLLQGAYTRSDRELPRQFAGPDSDERLAVLQEIAREVGRTSNQLVIAWMRQGTPSILPIIAGSRKEQLAENIAALEITLTEDQMQRLDTAGNPVIEQAWLQPT
ncbi:MAG: aldo/keto reductase [Acidobacteriota bacterium]|nr:aldo/keto reductase [Acidobacteriota bacterium]